MQPIKVESRNSGLSQTSPEGDDWRVLGYAPTPLASGRINGGSGFAGTGFRRISIGGIFAVCLLVLFSVGGVLVVAAPNLVSSIVVDGRGAFSRLAGWTGLKVQQISISGHRYASDIDIFEVLNKYVGTSLIGMDVRAASDELVKLPWVKGADISVEFPDELIVRIDERKPVAVWQVGQAVWLIDRDGEKLAQIRPGNFRELTQVSGYGAQKRIAGFIELLKTVPVMNMQVSDIKFIAGRRWTLQFKSGLVALLPARGVLPALKRLDQFLDSGYEKLPDLKTIDLRITDRIGLRHRQAALQSRVGPQAKVEPRKSASRRRKFSPGGTLTAADLSISEIGGQRSSLNNRGGGNVQY